MNMSKIHYSSRRYRLGDEGVINNIYHQVKGVARTREQWAWQWLETPAGPGDMWLIEATHPDGRSEVIGHHGMMPMRFTWGDNDLLIGRTENTMVLPEYRAKILYPRFENKFIKEYEERYDAFFSGSGPAEALRLRRAMGYKNIGRWQTLHSTTPLLGELVKLYNSIRGRLQGGKEHARPKVRLELPRNTRLPAAVSIVTSREAVREPFFAEYWPRARLNNGIAQSRMVEDLDWRFWTNPYTEHGAVIINNPAMGDSLFVFSFRTRRSAELVDFSFERPSEDVIKKSVPLALSAMHKIGVRLITSDFVDDHMKGSLLASYKKGFNGSLISTVRSLTHKKERPLPRRLTEKGIAKGLPLNTWDITPLAGYEGR